MNSKRLKQTIGLFLRRGAGKRGAYLREKHIFAGVGDNVRFQPRLIPLYPELIKLHNNIMIAAGVRLVTHDASFTILNRLGRGKFPEKVGCIEIMDNVFIGYNCTVLPNVRIGSNVILGASSTVTKDLESGGVYAGCPAKRVGSFEEYVQKCAQNSGGGYSYPYEHNQNISEAECNRAWCGHHSAPPLCCHFCSPGTTNLHPNIIAAMN